MFVFLFLYKILYYIIYLIKTKIVLSNIYLKFISVFLKSEYTYSDFYYLELINIYTYMSAALDFHKQHKGKLEIQSKTPLSTQEDLALAYTPGVAEPCLAIADDTEKSYEYTARGNMVLVISDGTAVLGLGDIGPEAAMPVMEGKAILFKEFAGVDAFPLCVDTKNIDEIVQLVRWLQPSFGGVNLEDISAPRCFEIEERLKQELSIPVFHDDQHGTAIVTLAGMINAAKVV